MSKDLNNKATAIPSLSIFKLRQSANPQSLTQRKQNRLQKRNQLSLQAKITERKSPCRQINHGHYCNNDHTLEKNESLLKINQTVQYSRFNILSKESKIRKNYNSLIQLRFSNKISSSKQSHKKEATLKKLQTQPFPGVKKAMSRYQRNNTSREKHDSSEVNPFMTSIEARYHRQIPKIRMNWFAPKSQPQLDKNYPYEFFYDSKMVKKVVLQQLFISNKIKKDLLSRQLNLFNFQEGRRYIKNMKRIRQQLFS